MLKQILPYKKWIVIGIIGTLIYAAMEASLVYLVKHIINNILVDRYSLITMGMPFIIMAVFFLRGGSSFSSAYSLARVSGQLVHNLRNQVFQQFLHMPARAYDKTNTGELLSQLLYNIGQMTQACTSSILDLIRNSATVIFLIITLFLIDWKLSLCLFLTVPLVSICLRITTKRLRKLSYNSQQAMVDVSKDAEETIKGYKVIRLNNALPFASAKFKQSSYNFFQQQLKSTITSSLNSSTVQIILSIPLGLIQYLIANPALHINLGSVAAIITGMIALLRPMRTLTNINAPIQQGIAAATTLYKFLDEDNEVNHGTIKKTSVTGAIVFNNVCFRYYNTGKTILKNINFTAQPGQTIAIVGHSGSGKSTLAHLLPRFYDITSGAITLDDININEYELNNLRSHIAMVGQDTFLFNQSILHNIAYPDQNPDFAKVKAAADMAYATEFIEPFPEKFDSIIGENGVLLSGGQRQRIALARAIYKNARILILDEATSALDTVSEQAIQQAFKKILGQQTTFIIAHRISTIEKADTILVMDNGCLVEQGTHSSLLKQRGHYANLYRTQFVDETVSLETTC